MRRALLLLLLALSSLASTLSVFPSSGPVNSLMIVTVDFGADVLFESVWLSSMTDLTLQEWFTEKNDEGKPPIYMQEANAVEPVPSSVQAIISDTWAIQLVFSFPDGPADSAHLVIHGGLFRYTEAPLSTLTIAWFGDERPCDLTDVSSPTHYSLPRAQGNVESAWFEQNASCDSPTLSFSADSTSLQVRVTVDDRGLQAPCFTLAGAEVLAPDGASYRVATNASVSLSATDPLQIITMSRVWQDLGSLTEAVDGDAFGWGPLDASAAIECFGQCGPRSFTSPGSHAQRHSLVKSTLNGGQTGLLLEPIATSDLQRNLTLQLSAPGTREIFLSEGPATIDNGIVIEPEWQEETVRTIPDAGILMLSGLGIENMAAVPLSVTGENCNQLAMTSAIFLSSPDFCDMSFGTCLPPSPWAILDESHILDAPVVEPQALTGSVGLASPQPRARFEVERNALVLEYRFSPVTLTISFPLHSYIQLEQPRMAIRRENGSDNCHWEYAADISNLTNGQVRLQVNLRNDGELAGSFLPNISCDTGLQVVELPNNSQPLEIGVSHSSNVTFVIEPTLAGDQNADLLTCLVSVDMLATKSLWEPVTDLCPITLDLFAGYLLPECSYAIQEPEVGVLNPLEPNLDIASSGLLSLALSSAFGATEIQLTTVIHNSGTGDGRFDVLVQCVASTSSNFTVGGELTHTLPNIIAGSRESLSMILSASLAVDSVHQCVMSVIPVRLDDIQCSNPIGVSQEDQFSVHVVGGTFQPLFTTSPSPSPSENATENATYTAYVAQVTEGNDQEDAFQDDIWNWLWGDRLVWQRVMVIVILLVVPGTLCCLCLCLASIGLRRFGGRETDVEEEGHEVREERFWEPEAQRRRAI